MREYTVTGVRHQWGEGPTTKPLTQEAERFVAQLEEGQEVMLMAEPENPVDVNAIAVYIDYGRVGYINKEDAVEAHHLLDEHGRGMGKVVRTDHHVTFFISIPGASEKNTPPVRRERVLPESVLGDSVKIPFTKSESALQLIVNDLLTMEISRKNIKTILKLTDLYLPHVKTSICHDDNMWLNRVEKRLYMIREQREALALSDEESARLDNAYQKVREAVGDMHCTSDHWPEQVFIHQLDQLRHDERTNTYLYKKYCDAFLGGKDFNEADKGRLKDEHERLTNWLKGMKWSELRNPRNLETMAHKVNYLGLSRQELYELYSVVLLIERLEESLGKVVVNHEEIVSSLKPIFFGDEDEINTFLKDIQGMKSTYITERVKQLVEEKKISDLSKKRALWEVLHQNELYECSESNWNQQLNLPSRKS